MHDLPVLHRAITSAPDPIKNFDAKAWLATFKAAGGSWLIVGDRAHLRYPEPSSPELHERRAALSEDEAELVRAEILTGYPAREG